MFEIMFVIVPILVICIFIFNFLMIFSPKLRGKFMSKQIKATKYMIDDARDDLQELGTTMGKLSADTGKAILDQNEDILKDIATRKAKIEKESIEIKMNAIKNGLSKNTIFCKHCGASIDEDSKFCKKCGKEQ